MYAPTIGYGVAVTGACIASALSGRADRYAATMISAGILASWLVFVTSWAPWSAAVMLSKYAIDTDSIDLWSMCNCLNAMLAVYLSVQNGLKQRWLVLMYVLLLSGCYFDVLWWASLVSWASFKRVIDIIFIGEIATLYLVGGRHAFDRVRSCIARWYFRGSVRSARQATAIDRG